MVTLVKPLISEVAYLVNGDSLLSKSQLQIVSSDGALDS